ncbi:MAG TPA: HDOD domain-containing protein [Gammaproteobacteria bacterium]|nr:HDOD domain-containing protein [Gammaproteobacteria bacterium]
MQPQDLVKGSVKLVSLPEIFIKVNEMVEDPSASASDVGRILCQDPALTARLLKIANSPLYGFPSRIDTVSRAITIIGMRGIRDLVLATSTIGMFSRLATEFLDMSNFWRHSIYCGVTARVLAGRCNALHVEPFFIGGLLHDIGHLIIIHKLPEMAREAHLRARDSGQPLPRMEREVIGFDHAQVGAELLRFWRLPDNLLQAVQFHHEPQSAPDFPLNAALTHIANQLANQSYPLTCRGDSQPGEVSDPLIQPQAWEISGLFPDVIDETREEVNVQFQAMLQLLLTQAA